MIVNNINIDEATSVKMETVFKYFNILTSFGLTSEFLYSIFILGILEIKHHEIILEIFFKKIKLKS